MSAIYRKRVGRRIKGLRLALGLSLDTVATRARIDKSQLSRFENGIRGLSVWSVVCLAKALKTSLDWMFLNQKRGR